MAKKKKKRSTQSAVRRTKAKRLPISAIRVKRLGYECEDLAEADVKAALRFSLAAAVRRHEKLAVAWRRGQLLRNLEGCAKGIMTVTQAAKLLGFENGLALRQVLDTDDEIRNIWEQHRIATIYSSKAALAEAAKGGNQAAIKAVEVFHRDEGEGVAVRVDYGRLSTNQLSELFMVSRQTVYDWYTKQQCPRNVDGTFDLKLVIRWFEEFTLKKAAKGKEILGDLDPLRTVRAQTLALELERKRGELLDRREVVAGQVARFRNLIESLNKLAREVAPMVVNQSIETIKKIFTSWRRDVIVAQRSIPAELQLPAKDAAALDVIYKNIGPINEKEKSQT